MIREHTCYHRSITGGEAEERLKSSGYDHCYLTRYSKQQKCYVLTVYQFQDPKHVTEHFKILIDNGKHCLDGKDDLFNDIDELLQHCESHPISPSFVHAGRKYTQEDYRNHNRRIREEEELKAREENERGAREENKHGAREEFEDQGEGHQTSKSCDIM